MHELSCNILILVCKPSLMTSSWPPSWTFLQMIMPLDVSLVGLIQVNTRHNRTAPIRIMFVGAFCKSLWCCSKRRCLSLVSWIKGITTDIHGPIRLETVERYASTIPIFGEQSREQNERLRIDCQTECSESAEVLSSPEIMENTESIHMLKSMQVTGQQKLWQACGLWTHVQRLLFYTFQNSSKSCHDQPLVRVAPKRYLASLAARWSPPGTRAKPVICGDNMIEIIVFQ